MYVSESVCVCVRECVYVCGCECVCISTCIKDDCQSFTCSLFHTHIHSHALPYAHTPHTTHIDRAEKIREGAWGRTSVCMCVYECMCVCGCITVSCFYFVYITHITPIYTHTHTHSHTHTDPTTHSHTTYTHSSRSLRRGKILSLAPVSQTTTHTH
jgi:hypothetical protein